MNDDDDFVNNFVQALGNIFKFTSRKAEFVFAGDQELLVSSDDFEAQQNEETPDDDVFTFLDGRLL